MKLSIVIPFYSEEAILTLALEQLNKLANAWISRDDCSETEFVMVNDGSLDRTYEFLVEVSKFQKQFKIILFSRNFGRQLAL